MMNGNLLIIAINDLTRGGKDMKRITSSMTIEEKKEFFRRILKREMKLQNIELKELAKWIGTTSPTLSSCLRGRNSRLRLFNEICDELGFDMNINWFDDLRQHMHCVRENELTYTRAEFVQINRTFGSFSQNCTLNTFFAICDICGVCPFRILGIKFDDLTNADELLDFKF